MSERDPPPDLPTMSLETGQQIDRVSDEFKRTWQAGPTPRIEDYLDRVPADGRLQLLQELLVVEFDLRLDEGQPLELDVYRQRFPDSEAVINAALALREQRAQGDLPRTAGASPGWNALEDSQPLPQRIGRFLIRRRLGRGGFGVVYLAYDPGLDRLVALKVPRSELLATDRQRDNLLHEARTAAKLKHPALVIVHEVQQETDRIYIVQEYIEGQNLAQWAATQQRGWDEIVRRMIEIATAIGYVHQQGFYHCDLKPGNILIDTEGHAHVADFGLAVHEDALQVLQGNTAGTPQYMSPEQVRGETHWIDGRTDIWALGVILYELLAGQRPFAAPDRQGLFQEIQERDPKSPRMKNPAVPRELERICLKCLAKRRTHRYANASDMLEDLTAFLTTCPESTTTAAEKQASGAIVAPRSGAAVGAGSAVGPDTDSTRRQSTSTPNSGPQPALRIVPKGLRSFDKEDKDFFLELLPSPRDREGLPDSIRFWKTRIEEMDADATFPVGVMYGPSGCGKSSLVKAGLLPRLLPHVLPILVEATPSDTELRLLKTLRKHVPQLAADMSLPEVLAQLREGRVTDGRKVLLVLDQFEQWLHATANMDSTQLVRALRQCDGAKVQCLILVRDDFWMSTTRFMQALEIPQLEGVNSAAVDLFDPSHARKVLRAFGFAYGRLPEHELQADERRFLDRGVQDLARGGKVICVQLSLFADMMKGRPWTPASLQEAGGTSGVGVAFLDETFTAKTAPPTHRLHAKAAQAVLNALLPEAGTDIKGQMQPAERLLECSGYAARPGDFRNLLQILNRELRLITPTEPEEPEAGIAEPSSTTSDRQFYQLTHDYLVPSLQAWLTRKQKETRRGRAQLRLADSAAMWTARPESRHLPSFLEFVNIRTRTTPRDWTEAQRKMIRAATRHYGVIGIGVLALLLVTAMALQQFVAIERRKSVDDAIVTLRSAHGPAVPLIIDNLKRLPRPLVRQKLETLFDRADNSRKLTVAYALADPDFGQVNSPFLVEAVAHAPADECDNLVTALGHAPDLATLELQNAAETATDDQNWQLKSRLATIAMHLGDASIAAEMVQAEPSEPEQPEKLVPAWEDVPPDPKWAAVNADTKTTFEAAHGIVTERFALCQDMPWDAFLATSESLRSCGYRPTRVRPFTRDTERLTAAVWTRDARRWTLDVDRTADQLPQPETTAARDGMVPLDVAGYAAPSDTLLYAVLWCDSAAEAEQRRLAVGMTEQELATTGTAMQQAGLLAQKTLQVVTTHDGTRRYAGIWSNQGQACTAVPNRVGVDPTTRVTHESLADISLAPIGTLPDPLDLYRQQLAAIATWPAERQNAVDVRRSRATAQYYLDQPEQSLTDLDYLTAQKRTTYLDLQLRALSLAKLGRAEEARTAYEEFVRVGSPMIREHEFDRYVSIVLSGWLGDLKEASLQLDAMQAANRRGADTLYYAARAAAQLARAAAPRDPEAAARFEVRSLELLRSATSQGLDDISRLLTDADLIPLRGKADFLALVGQLAPLRPYAMLMEREERKFESRLLAESSVEEQLAQARELAAEGFRPLALAVNVVAGDSELRSAAVWHRPGPSEMKWDPIQRTMFIEQFPKWSGDWLKLADVLRDTEDSALRSAMGLALGGIEEPNDVAKQKWEQVLEAWHREQPDSGTHSASGWTLRRWGLSPEIPKEPQSHKGHSWRTTKTGLTLIHIPAGEVQAANAEGLTRRIRISHDFWLNDREMTWDVFRQFLTDKDADKPDNAEQIRRINTGDPELPVVGVSWYEAVMFCNWLSGQDGRDPCYQKDGTEQIWDHDNTTREYGAWKLIPGSNGYRLPTEDEWEYACRARTTTMFSFGDAEELSDRYAVFVKNAKNGPARAGHKLCNAWGLFDMHGNVWEWCQDWHTVGSYRVDRGGSWSEKAAVCQSAGRFGYQPSFRLGSVGFRVASVPPDE